MKKTHPILVGIDSVKPYKVRTSHSLYDIQPPAMQIADFLPVGGIMGITSYPGAGKSWLAMAIAKAVGGGEDFLGKFKARRGGVLFVGSDSSLYDYARQWTRLTSHTELAAHVYEPVRFLVQSSFMFEDRDEVRRLIRTHQQFEWGDFHQTESGMEREKGFHVIVFDTVSRLTRANQNDNTEMEEVFRHIRWIAEATDAAVILIHHNSKRTEFNDGSDWRGAMSQIGALDSWIQLTPSANDKFRIGVEYKKFRGITPANFAYKMNVMDPQVASLVWTDEAVLTKRASKQIEGELGRELLKRVKEKPGLRSVELADDLWNSDWRQNTTEQQWTDRNKLAQAVRNALKAMTTNGIIAATAGVEGKPVYSELLTQPKETTGGKVVEEQAVKAGDGDPVDTPKAPRRVPKKGAARGSGDSRPASQGVSGEVEKGPRRSKRKGRKGRAGTGQGVEGSDPAQT